MAYTQCLVVPKSRHQKVIFKFHHVQSICAYL